MQHCDYMEVDGLPDLPCLRQPIKEESNWLLQTPVHVPLYQSGNASANASAIRLVKEPMAIAISQVQPQRQQQTNQPMCPPTHIDLDADCPSAPSIVVFGESNDFPSLPIEDIMRILGPLPQTQEAPSVPEIADPSSPSQLHIVMLPQPPHIPQHSRPRQRSDTITLLSDREGPATPSSSCCNFEVENSEVMRRLMDDDVSDDESGPTCCEPHIPIPSCKATSQEQRMYQLSASFILTLHLAKSRDVPHAKKKPMVHEFLAYILFGSDHEQLACLKGTVYFCRDNGDRVVPTFPDKKFFRVANFQAVSEVWRMVKCNSSKDCIKNMKRAMRMSTSNGRKFFVNLPHRMHRMQIFQFGDRSIEFFSKAFPEYFNLR